MMSLRSFRWVIVTLCALAANPTQAADLSNTAIVQASETAPSPSDRADHVMLRLSIAMEGVCSNRWRKPGFETVSESGVPQVSELKTASLKGRLQPGDIILGRNDQPMTHFDPSLQIDLALGRLKVRRDQQVVMIQHDVPLSCYRPLHIKESRSVSAKSRADGIELSTGLIKLARTDAELAFPIAHELAHFALDHSRRIAEAKQARRDTPGFRRNLEREADLAALWMMEQAGYHARSGKDFLAQTSSFYDLPQFGLAHHLPRKKRVRTLQKALPLLDADLSLSRFLVEAST